MKMIFMDCNWQVDKLPGGLQIGIADRPTKVEVVVPFGDTAVPDLIRAIVQNSNLTDDQKRELAPLFNGGIFLPGQDFKAGPQG